MPIATVSITPPHTNFYPMRLRPVFIYVRSYAMLVDPTSTSNFTCTWLYSSNYSMVIRIRDIIYDVNLASYTI